MNFISVTVLMFLSCVFYAVQFGDMTPILAESLGESGIEYPCNDNSCTEDCDPYSGLCLCHNNEASFCHVSCIPDQDFNTCHHNAKCKHEDENGLGLCICNKGYVGNGKICEEIQPPTPTTSTTTTTTTPTPAPIQCSESHECDYNAECKQDTTYKICKCKEGYHGNGRICEVKCNVTNPLCDENADCKPVDGTDYGVCKCNEGFIEIGGLCSANMEIQPPATPIPAPIQPTCLDEETLQKPCTLVKNIDQLAECAEFLNQNENS